MTKIKIAFAYPFIIGGLLLAAVFSMTKPAKAQGPVSLPDVPGYYWWIYETPVYEVDTAVYDPVGVSCDPSGCSGTLSESGYLGPGFGMIISDNVDYDDYMHVFDVSFQDLSDEGDGQYSAEYGRVSNSIFGYAYPLPTQTYRVCAYDVSIPQVAIDWASTNCDVVHAQGTPIHNNGLGFGGSWQTAPFNFVITIDWIGSLRLEEETPPMPMPEFCYITITDTVTITDSMGVTSTQIITTEYTAESNLVQNYSFEDGNTTPDEWESVVGGQVSVVPPYYQPSTPSLARTGDDSVYNGGTFELWNDLPVVEGGLFLGGFYARCVSSDCAGSEVTARWNSSPLVTATNIISSYSIYSGTQETGGGASWFILSFDSGEGDVHIDDAFVYPIDENGDLNCDPAYYEPPEEEENVIPGPDGIPIPWGGAGTICYNCRQPSTDHYTYVNFWIAWLGCVIRNMFACSLRIWLLRIENATVALVLYLATLAGWIAGNSQAAVNWGLAMANFWVDLALAFWTELVSGLSGLSVVVNVYDSTFGLVEAIINLLIALAQLLLGILDALVSFAELAVDFLQAIWSSWSTPAYGLDEIIFGTPLESGGGGIDGAMSSPGVNDAKAFVYTVWGLMAMDKIGYGLYLNFVQYPILGLFGFVVGKWFMDQLKELMPV